MGIKKAADREVFQFMSSRFDVTMAKRLVEQKAVESVTVEGARGYFGFIGTNSDFVLTADLSKPVILATIKVDGQLVKLPIDGWHRLKRAAELGVLELPARILTYAETNKCRF